MIEQFTDLLNAMVSNIDWITTDILNCQLLMTTVTTIQTQMSLRNYITWLTWPWPSEMELNFCPPNPLSSANLSKAIVGSAPGERMKINGALNDESLYDLAKSNGGGSTKLLPSFSVTNFTTAGITCKISHSSCGLYL